MLAISTLLTETKMKKQALQYFGMMLAILWTSATYAQITTDPPEYEDPTTELKIIVDLNALDASLDHTQNLLDAAAAGEEVYFYTWSPVEHPVGHPLVNGNPPTPWKDSNDTLVMTKEGDNLYSITMIPTEFYETDAQTVFANDIKFLIKTKDGGGFGDPDIKSEDLTLLIDPPVTTRNPAFLFPGSFKDDDLVMLYYDNNQETVTGMQNLADDDVWFYAEATLSDSTKVRIANNAFTVGNFPELQMTSYGDGLFKTFFVPRKFFNVPEEKNVTDITIFIMRRVFAGGESRISYDIIAELSCE